MDVSWKDSGEIFAILFFIGAFLWLWLRPKIQGEFATKADFSKHKQEINERLSAQDERIETLSTLVRDLIVSVDRRLTGDVAALRADIAGLSASVAASTLVTADLKESVRDLNNHIINGKKP